MSTVESALVVLVPQAEGLVKPYRDRHDPSAALGVPAHVTLLYPFLAPDIIGAEVLAKLQRCLAEFTPFAFDLTRARRFPGVLYLVPEPDDVLRQLTLAIWGRFPETPPYAGRHADVVPHLTVAEVADERRLDALATDFAKAAATSLPIHVTANSVALMDNSSGLWRVRQSFRLGA